MTSSRKFLAAFFAACFMTVAAFAADASPAGTWKYSQPGRGGGNPVERTLVLDQKDGKITGTLKGAQMGQFEIPDVAIANATLKDGVIAFTVTNDFNGNAVVTKFEGKLAGDEIKGTTERTRNGEAVKTEWLAKRAK